MVPLAVLPTWEPRCHGADGDAATLVHMREFAVYALMRLALWVVIWWLLTLAGVGLLLAGVLAAFLAMLVSILLLDRQRDAAAQRWRAANERRRARRGPARDTDADEEDALVDADSDDAAAGDTDSAPADPGASTSRTKDDESGEHTARR